MHCILCLDGSFEQKRCNCAGSGDQPIPTTQCFFIPESRVTEMREYVEKQRNIKTANQMDDEDTIIPGLPMANHIFDSCTSRFVAAKETNKKAEASIFSDTGLMALTCRHDRVLFMVNLRDAGEKQYNVLALLKQLFLELPSDWHVGVLYDIGCQLHKSIKKVMLRF